MTERTPVALIFNLFVIFSDSFQYNVVNLKPFLLNINILSYISTSHHCCPLTFTCVFKLCFLCVVYVFLCVFMCVLSVFLGVFLCMFLHRFFRLCLYSYSLLKVVANSIIIITAITIIENDNLTGQNF